MLDLVLPTPSDDSSELESEETEETLVLITLFSVLITVEYNNYYNEELIINYYRHLNYVYNQTEINYKN